MGEGNITHLVEYILEALLRERRALQVLDRADIFGHGDALVVLDGGHAAKGGGELSAQVALGKHTGRAASR